MKKFLSMIAAVSLLAASLSACGASSTASTTAAAAAPAAEGGKEYKVAIVQQLDHASLDEIRVAIEAELEAKAAEKGIAITYKDFTFKVLNIEERRITRIEVRRKEQQVKEEKKG